MINTYNGFVLSKFILTNWAIIKGVFDVVILINWTKQNCKEKEQNVHTQYKILDVSNNYSTQL